MICNMHFISIITSIPPKIIRHKIMEVDLMGNPDLDDSKIGNWNSSGAGGKLSPLSVPGHHGQVFSAGCLSSAGYKTLHSFHILCSFLYIDLRVSCIYSTLLTSSLKIFIWAFSKASALAKKKKYCLSEEVLFLLHYWRITSQGIFFHTEFKYYSIL